MTKTFLYIFLCILFVTCPVLAQAEEEKSDHELFLRYLTTNTAYQSYLRSKQDRLFKLTFPECNEIESVRRLSPTIILQPAFRSDSLTRGRNLNRYNFQTMHPTFGQWIDHSLVTGCDNITQLNFIATAYDIDRLPYLLPSVNGQTKVDIMDQDKVELAIKDKLNETLGCLDNVFVLGSIVLGYKDPNSSAISKTNHNIGWYERWIVEACGNYHNINLAILPHGKTRFKYIVQLAPKEDKDKGTEKE